MIYGDVAVGISSPKVRASGGHVPGLAKDPAEKIPVGTPGRDPKGGFVS